MRAECLRGADARLRPARGVLTRHQFIQGSERSIAGALALALMATKHLMLEFGQRADVEEEARFETEHVYRVEPPQRRLCIERRCIAQDAARGGKPRSRFRQGGCSAMVRMGGDPISVAETLSLGLKKVFNG